MYHYEGKIKKDFVFVAMSGSETDGHNFIQKAIDNGSKMIINGDKTQVDLPKGSHMSGLVDAENKLKGISGISFVEFDAFDVVRHPLVSSIIDAYSDQGE